MERLVFLTRLIHMNGKHLDLPICIDGQEICVHCALGIATGAGSRLGVSP